MEDFENLTIKDLIGSTYGSENTDKIIADIKQEYKSGKRNEEFKEGIEKILLKYEESLSKEGTLGLGTVVGSAVGSATGLVVDSSG